VTEIATQATARAISPEPGRLSEFGVEWVQRRIQEDLARLDVRHDQLFLESSLYAGWDEETMAKLASLGRVAQHDGATWFKSDSGKDEVLIKRDGYPTYFWSDILYHRDKFEKRGFDRVVDVWGADHQGQIGRVREALAAAIHRLYKNCRVVTEDAPLTGARLLLSRAARTTIGSALGLMGVAAPDRM